MDGVHELTLTDSRGQPHAYVVTEHPAGDGVPIVFELMGLLGPTVLQGLAVALGSDDLLRSILEAVRGGEIPAEGDALDEAAEQVAGLDLGKLTAEASRALLSGRGPALVQRIVSRSIRDGQPVPTVFEQAYQANYMELLQLVWKVCQINRFFPVPSTS